MSLLRSLAILATVAMAQAVPTSLPTPPSDSIQDTTIPWTMMPTNIVPKVTDCIKASDLGDIDLNSYVTNAVDFLVIPNLCEDATVLGKVPELIIDNFVSFGRWISDANNVQNNGRTAIFPLAMLRPRRHTIFLKQNGNYSPCNNHLDASQTPSSNLPETSFFTLEATDPQGDYGITFSKSAPANGTLYAVIRRQDAICEEFNWRGDCPDFNFAVPIQAFTPGSTFQSSFADIITTVNSNIAQIAASSGNTVQAGILTPVNPDTDTIFLTVVPDYFPSLVNSKGVVGPSLLPPQYFQILSTASSDPGFNTSLASNTEAYSAPWLIENQLKSVWEQYSAPVAPYGNWCQQGSGEVAITDGGNAQPIDAVDNACKTWVTCNNAAYQSSKNTTQLFCDQLICNKNILTFLEQPNVCAANNTACTDFVKEYTAQLEAKIWIVPSVGLCPEMPPVVVPTNNGGYTTGDPHQNTYDGIHYDFQVPGDYLYTRIYKNTPNEIVLHARQTYPTFTTVVCLKTALAFRSGINGDVIDFFSSDSANIMTIVISGKVVTIPVGTTFSVKGATLTMVNQASVVINTGIGSSFNINAYAWGGIGNLDVYISLAENAFGTTDGLLGTFNGNPQDDYTLADGSSCSISSPACFQAFTSSYALNSTTSLVSDTLAALYMNKRELPNVFVKRDDSSASLYNGNTRTSGDNVTAQIQALPFDSDDHRALANSLCSAVSQDLQFGCMQDLSFLSTAADMNATAARHNDLSVQVNQLSGVGVANVSVTASNDSALVSWTLIPGTPAADSFIVSYQLLPQSGGVKTVTVDSNQTYVIISGLIANATYDVRVRHVAAVLPSAITLIGSTSTLTSTKAVALDPSTAGASSNGVNSGSAASSSDNSKLIIIGGSAAGGALLVGAAVATAVVLRRQNRPISK